MVTVASGYPYGKVAGLGEGMKEQKVEMTAMHKKRVLQDGQRHRRQNH